MASRLTAGAAVALALAALAAPAQARFLIAGNDQKLTWNDDGKPVLGSPGADTVSVIDVGTDPARPRIVASLPLENSVVGPPTNIVVTPDETLALVADSVDVVRDGDALKQVPDSKVHVIDLTASPPAALGTVEVGGQPSGMAINREGTLALSANRAGKSVSVLAIRGREVRRVADVDVGDVVAAVAFASDGRHAYAVKFPAHKLAVLDVDGEKVTYGGTDTVTTGLWPYNVAVTPDGRLALVADNGASGASDGNVDTVSVVDLEASPPRAIDRVVVGDGPEGLAISPRGDLAVAVLLNGSWAVPRAAWYANPRSKLALLAIDGERVTKVGETEVGGLAEGAAFSPDGGYLYVGNFRDGDLSILRVEGRSVRDTGERLKLPGRPASLGIARP